MDQHDGLLPGAEPARSALQVAHGTGLLALIGVLVLLCGVGMQAFLGDPGDPGAAVAGPDPGPLSSPGPDQQAAYLEAVRLSGTGSWSSRLDVLGYGVQACRMFSAGRPPGEVVRALVAAGEPRAQAQAVTAAAPRTLCPPERR